MNGDAGSRETCTKNRKVSEANLIQMAEELLGETPEQREQDIEKLRQMLKDDPELEVPEDVNFLLKFLRAKKYNYSRTFKLIQRYYKLRSEYSKLYTKYYPSAVTNAFANNLQTVLPDFDEMGRKIFVYRAGQWDPEKCTMDDIFLANQLCLEKAIEDEQAQILGLVAIVDMKNFSFSHLKSTRPSDLKKMMTVIQGSFPARFKGFHIVNQPAIFEMLFMLVKPFLSQKIKSRIFFHGSDLTALHENVSPEVLPEELGGELGKMDNSPFVKELLSSDEHFRRSTKYGYVTNSPDAKCIALTTCTSPN